MKLNKKFIKENFFNFFMIFIGIYFLFGNTIKSGAGSDIGGYTLGLIFVLISFSSIIFYLKKQ